jgi:hypothetical protein
MIEINKTKINFTACTAWQFLQGKFYICTCPLTLFYKFVTNVCENIDNGFIKTLKTNQKTKVKTTPQYNCFVQEPEE